MTTFRITIVAEIPAPREFTCEEHASNEAAAVSRALKRFRTHLGRPKQIKEWKIRVLRT